MYKVRVKRIFSAAHNICYEKGRGESRKKCEGLHGHNWEVQVCVESEELNKEGMVIDFRYLKKQVEKLIKELDHRYLNHILPFNPTSENIARYIFQRLKEKFARQRYRVSEVIVRESKDTEAEYKEGE